MFDICFFQSSNKIKKEILDKNTFDATRVYDAFEGFRSKHPFVFNIETTNVCNMKCIMCPRPALMKRPVKHMDMSLFEKVIKQINPHKHKSLDNFWRFIANEYATKLCDRNENAFYFYTVSKSLTLHGYGEPPLDPYIAERIRLCAKRNIPTYFSCVPANIDIEKVIEMMRAGLGVIKFAMDALDDKTEKRIRGPKSDFTDSYKKICDLIEIKSKDPSIKTEIAITMLELSKDESNVAMFKDFMRLWNSKPVYAYVKSQDNRWFHEEDPGLIYKPHYASQYCEFPWTSMTVMADGSVVPCTQDYNCEMTLGNANAQSLEEIWNSEAYDNFRKWHIYGNFPEGYKCPSRCDLKMVCDKKNGVK